MEIRDLTLFGKTMIIKTFGVSSLIYSASNINVPIDIAGNVKRRLFSFLRKNKRDIIKREGLNQDYDNGGLRMTDIEVIYQTRGTVFHGDIQTPRIELKIRRAAEYF